MGCFEKTDFALDFLLVLVQYESKSRKINENLKEELCYFLTKHRDKNPGEPD